MARQLITAVDIREAKRNGTLDLALAEGCLVTPQAADEARRLGVRLQRGRGVPAPGPVSAPERATPTPAPRPQAAAAANATGDALFAEVRRLVAAKLPAEARNSPLVDQLVKKALDEALYARGACGLSCPALDGASAAPAKDPAKDQVGGVVRVNSRALPWENFSQAPCKELVNIVDVITDKDGSPLGVGYLEWEKASFPWTLNYYEVDIVLEGSLHITVGGQTLVGKPGDVFYVPKGTNLVFGSPGYVKFAYVTWPADWASQG